jgi:hypothetical protein
MVPGPTLQYSLFFALVVGWLDAQFGGQLRPFWLRHGAASPSARRCHLSTSNSAVEDFWSWVTFHAACPRIFPGVGTYANKHRKLLFVPPYKAEVLVVGYTVVSTVSVWLTQGTRR